MNLKDAYQKIWAGKMVGIQPPQNQSIDRVNWTIELCPNERNAGPLVDIGTGSGAMLARAAGRGWDSWGTELDQGVGDWLRSQGHKVFTMDASTEGIPLPDGSVGVVTLCDVIEHLVDPKFALAQAFRILRPGGYIFVATPNAAAWRRVQQLALGTMFRTSGDNYLRDGGHLAYYAPADLAGELSSVGFQKVEVALRKSDPCPGEIWGAFTMLGAQKRAWSEHVYMIGVGRR